MSCISVDLKGLVKIWAGKHDFMAHCLLCLLRRVLLLAPPFSFSHFTHEFGKWHQCFSSALPHVMTVVTETDKSLILFFSCRGCHLQNCTHLFWQRLDAILGDPAPQTFELHSAKE